MPDPSPAPAADPSTDPANSPAPSANPPAPTPPATDPANPPAPPAAPPQQPAEGDVSSLPEWAQKLIQGAQPAPQPTPPAAPAQAPEGDLSKLPRWAQQQLTTAQEQARTAAVQAAVLRAAPAAQADPVALLDSQSAMSALAAVDPVDQAAVTAAITAAVRANPRLAAGPARAGADFTPGSNEITPAQFAAMGYAERADLFRSDPETYRRLAGS
ncbi:hypothetical protein [Streptomyces sp. SID5910]|uniref:hypothetical protein n=1 Tax=Streptomyces sp. SID5910 TaxID=2690312 RepID=UPI00136816FF|nr:hypothetical protein [Streptomyces sp. SID5910]MYR46602.1 hypothetical protein [Streptomyces sp. SID5910]